MVVGAAADEARVGTAVPVAADPSASGAAATLGTDVTLVCCVVPSVEEIRAVAMPAVVGTGLLGLAAGSLGVVKAAVSGMVIVVGCMMAAVVTAGTAVVVGTEH